MKIFILLSFLSLCACSTVPLEKTRAPSSNQNNNTVLILGDSHMVGDYGTTLSKRISTKAETLMLAVCGAGAASFLRTPVVTSCGKTIRKSPTGFASQLENPLASIPETVQTINPNIVVIGLGTNYGNNSPSSMQKLVELIAKNAPALTKVIWIGPPFFYKKEGDSLSVVKSIRSSFGLKDEARGNYKTTVSNLEIVFVDSTSFNKTSEPLSIPKGHFHFGPQTAKQWAEYNWAAIEKEL